MKRRKLTILFIVVVAVLIILDQILKIWVKTHMTLGENIALLGNWFNLYFIENEGMAFGISFGKKIGKLFLSLMRLGIAGFLIYYVLKIIRKGKTDTLVVIIFSLIIAGALGNIIDSCFYGLIFSESTWDNVAVAFPPEGGYGKLFFGKVVDMFYLRLFLIPEWFPIWSGSYFFPAIFNIADSCVTVGLILLLIFNRRIFSEKKTEEEIVAIPEETEG